LRAQLTPLLVSSVLKLFLLPLFTSLACLVYRVTPTGTLITVLFSALPASASSYVLARQLGGDESLMAAIITTQVIIAALSLPLIVGIFT